jgi:predicted nucleic acid-binding protein
MPFVLDASIVGCWALEDENHPIAETAFAQIKTDEAIVPNVFWFEVRNILVINERLKRITESEITAFLRNLSRFRMRIDGLPEEAQLLHLARTHRLSVYDAAYLELAQRERIPLATLDVKLAAAAHAENVPLLGPPR